MRLPALALCLLLPAAAAAEPGPAPDGASDAQMTLLVAGDTTLGHRLEEYLEEKRAKEGWSKERVDSYAFDRLRPVTRAADLFLVNLESPFTWRGRKLDKNFAFRARPEYSAMLADGGVGAVSLANNHLFDYGPDGVADTITTLRARDIAFFGAGLDEASARAPAIVERRGVKIALLGYLFLGDGNIEPKTLYAAGRKPGVAGVARGEAKLGAMVEQDVRAAAALADVVVPFFHWGREGQNEVLPWQRALARRAVAAGARLVLGAHPHVIHGIEVIDGVPVVYSLGNFVFGGNWGPRVQTSMMVRARLTKQGVAGLDVLPMQYTNPPDALFQPRLLEGDEARAVLDHLAGLSSKFERTLPELQRAEPQSAVPVPAPAAQ